MSNACSSERRPIFIAGPTAVGKSAVALELAARLRGEIVSVDSMQVYRGLDIGTAKPAAAEQAQVRHHLIDIVDLRTAFDAAKFRDLAQQAVQEIQGRGHIAIFCGGTGLYFKAFLEGLGDAPPSDPTLRAEIERMPLEHLLVELREKDPETFARIDQKNPRRVVRAIEVIRLTGEPYSAQRADWQKSNNGEESRDRMFGLSRYPSDLRRRIDVRVDEMFRQGLVEETKQLLQHGLEQNVTAMQAIGYRQVVEYLRDERSLEETIELVKIRTRQFAKRQLTWFRRQLHLDWLPLQPDTQVSDIVATIESKYHARTR